MVSKRTLQNQLEVVGKYMGISTTPKPAPKGSKNKYRNKYLYLDQSAGKTKYHPLIKHEDGTITGIGLDFSVSANECHYFLMGLRHGLEFKMRGR